MNALACALDLASQGVAVFACRSDKKPATPHGFKDATRDPAAISLMWHRSGGPLVGIPTGMVNDVDILDVDPRHGGDTWFKANAARLPETRQHSTRSGGRHVLFRHLDGIRNSESKIAPGIDVRGEGGYIIWWPGFGGDVIDPAAAAEWPTWLAEMLLPKPSLPRSAPLPAPLPAAGATGAARMLARIFYRLETASEGARHRQLRAASCTLGGLLDQLQISEDAAARSLLESVQRAGGNAVDLKNASATIAWGLARGRLSPLQIGGARNAR